jgi:hypothetical protein
VHIEWLSFNLHGRHPPLTMSPDPRARSPVEAATIFAVNEDEGVFEIARVYAPCRERESASCPA